MRTLNQKQLYISFGTSLLVIAIMTGYVVVNNNISSATINEMQKKAQSYYVDFNQSMQIDAYQTLASRQDNNFVLNTLRALYIQNSPAKIIPSATPKIPPYIHIMWLGGKLPEEYRKYVQSWRTYHPEWTIVFWTNSDANYDQGNVVVSSFEALHATLHTKKNRSITVDVRNLLFDNRIFYDQAVNYGEKSDILKWEIVYRFGGVWVDTDFECLRPLDIFNHLYDFYTGIQPLDTNIAQLGAALFAARPHHPILEHCVNTIKHNQHIQQIVVKTGPIHFTKSFLAIAGTTPGLIDVALPASYFYPCGYEQKGMEKQAWCKPESFAVHHWAGSWLKPEAFTYG